MQRYEKSMGFMKLLIPDFLLVDNHILIKKEHLFNVLQKHVEIPVFAKQVFLLFFQLCFHCSFDQLNEIKYKTNSNLITMRTVLENKYNIE